MSHSGDASRFLGRVKAGAYQRARRGAHLGRDTARVRGTIDAYAASLSGSQHRLGAAMLHNPVKVCPSCGKPNGYTLLQCNKCRGSLATVPLSETPNLFSGFLLGIESGGRFALTISLRHESEAALIFDDPLAISPLHFCAVPTAAVIPDWRHLTLHPQEGLRLHQRLLDACHNAAYEDFFSDATWCTSLLRTPVGADWRAHMIAGYNYPPSQNQLHIQYMSPLLMPHQHMLFKRGVHFTHMRFFPVEYVAMCLERLAAAGDQCTPADLQLPIEDFVALLERKCAVAYTPLHARFHDEVSTAYRQVANWTPGHFTGEYVCEDGAAGSEGRITFHHFSPPSNEAEGSAELLSEQTVFEQEKKSLESYGVAANVVDRSLGYYSFSRTLEELDTSFLRL